MSDEPKKPEKPDDNGNDAPDGRGPRPTDPNELAKWIVDQTTSENTAKQRQDEQV